MLTADEISKLPTNPDKSSAEAGKDTMLYVDDGAGTSTPNWVIVGGQRNSLWIALQMKLMHLTRPQKDGRKLFQALNPGVFLIPALSFAVTKV